MVRAALEAVLILALFIGCVKLANSAMSIYPTIVRSPDYRVSLGTAKDYEPLVNEVVVFAQDILEAIYTRTEKGSPVGIIQPYVAPSVAIQVNNMRIAGAQAGFVQSAQLSGFFISEQVAEGITGYAEVTVTQRTKNNIMMDTLYFNLAIRRVPVTKDNPTGWQLIGIKDVPRDTYLQEQAKALQEEAEPNVRQSVLDFDF